MRGACAATPGPSALQHAGHVCYLAGRLGRHSQLPGCGAEHARLQLVQQQQAVEHALGGLAILPRVGRRGGMAALGCGGHALQLRLQSETHAVQKGLDTDAAWPETHMLQRRQ